MSYQVPQHIDPNKVFLINHSELEGRLDSDFYNPSYYQIFGSDKVKWVRLKTVIKNLKHPPEYKRVFATVGYQLIRSQNVRPTGINLSESPVFLADEVVQSSSAIFPHVNDILIVRSGVNAGDVAVVEEEYKKVTIGADTLLLNVTQDVLPKFVQIYFMTEIGRKQLNRHITGATNKHLNSYSLKRVYFHKMNLLIQSNCVSIVESAYAENNRRQEQAKALLQSIDSYLLNELGIQLLETKSQTIQDRMFVVNFSEVSCDRYDPKYNKNISYIRSANSVFPWRTLDDVVKNNGQYGANESALDYNIGDIRYIRITDIDENGNLKVSDKKTAEKIDCSYLLNYNDVLFARSGSVGRCYIHKDTSEPAIFAGYLIRYELDIEKIIPDYLFYYCNSSIYHFWVETIQRPAVQANINSQEFSKLPIPLPPLQKQQEIVDHISAIRQQAKALQEEGKAILEQAKKEVEQMILGN